MNLQGTVRVSATVTAEGRVKGVKALGGSPLLVQASQSAIQEWKFAPAASETEEIIEFHFHP
jgi:TonB family protein